MPYIDIDGQGVVVGMWYVPIKEVRSGDNGWDNSWVPEMSDWVIEKIVGRCIAVSASGATVSGTYCGEPEAWEFPPHCLKRISSNLQ